MNIWSAFYSISFCARGEKGNISGKGRNEKCYKKENKGSLKKSLFALFSVEKLLLKNEKEE